MDLGLRGKVALVAAASQGMGRAAAAVLAREGCRIAICARNPGPLEATAKAIRSEARGDVLAVTADLSPFAGRKLSIFYRPDRIRWQVIIGTHILSGSPGIVYLGEPVIDTDRDGVREYMKRRTTRAQ